MNSRAVGSFDNNTTVLFDEIDSMYNCFRSELNQPSMGKPVAHPLLAQDSAFPLHLYYQLVVSYCYDYKSVDVSAWGSRWATFLRKFDSDYRQCNSEMKFNFDYGLGGENLLAIPYSAVNTPVIGSRFSDIDKAAILTCLCRRAAGLTIDDFRFLQVAVHHLKQKFIKHAFVPEALSRLLSKSVQQMVAEGAQNEEIQRFYLSCVLLPLKLHAFTQQRNVSFIDLMDDGFAQRRVGFSGTNLMLVPEFAVNQWAPDIRQDLAGQQAIKQNIKGDPNRPVLHYTSFQQLLSVLSQYDVLIDAGALLRSEGTALEIVTKWATAQRDQCTYVFIDAAHQPREYTPGATNHPVYKYSADRKFRWYFDQQHTVGIDLRVADKANGLVLVNLSSRLTDVAQAVYRLRDLGNQSVAFLLESPCDNCANNRPCRTLKQGALYGHLLHNDKNFLEAIKGRHFLQTLKTLVRYENEYRSDSYREPVRYGLSTLSIPAVSAVPTEQSARARDGLQRYLYQFDSSGGEDVQTEKEQERETQPADETRPCFYMTEKSATAAAYESSDWGAVVMEGLSISPHVIELLPRKQASDQLDTICFLHLPSGHCKIITIAEALLLRAKNQQTERLIDEVLPLRAKNQQTERVVYRLDPAPMVPKANFLVALAVCGKALTLDQQLIVIQATGKEVLRELARCFQQLQYDIFADYLSSALGRKEYLAQFSQQSYETFVGRWVKLPLPIGLLQDYFNQCIRLAEKVI